MLATLLLAYLSGFVAMFGFIAFVDANTPHKTRTPLDLHVIFSLTWFFTALSLIACLLDSEDE